MPCKRSSFLAIAIVSLLVGVVLGCSKGKNQETDTTQKANSLRVALFQAPASNALAGLLPQFESREGVSVTYDLLPYADLKSKVEQQFYSRSGDYDVVMADCIWIPSFAARGFLAEVDTSSVAVNDQQNDLGDLLPALDDYLSRFPKNGPRYGMPFMSNTHMMAYRVSLVEPVARSLGLSLPQSSPETAWTWDEYVKVADAITAKGRNADPQVFGTSMQARAGAWIVYEWYSILFGFVDDPSTRATGLPPFGEDAVRAMDLYTSMYSDAPRASLTWGHEEETSAMCAGLTAMDATSNVELASLLMRAECNPEDLRFAYPPVGRSGRGSPDMGGYGLMISRDAKDIGLASRFVLWAASKDVHRQIVLAGGTPIRRSEVRDAEILAKFPYLALYDRLIEDSVYRARIPNWPELEDILSRELTNVMEGNKSAPAAANAISSWVTANVR